MAYLEKSGYMPPSKSKCGLSFSAVLSPQRLLIRKAIIARFPVELFPEAGL